MTMSTSLPQNHHQHHQVTPGPDNMQQPLTHHHHHHQHNPQHQTQNTQQPISGLQHSDQSRSAISVTSSGPNSSSNLQHVLRAAKVPPELSLCQAMNDVHVTLEDAELWRNFKKCENEMIVTKSGRSVLRLFSCLGVRILILEFYRKLMRSQRRH